MNEGVNEHRQDTRKGRDNKREEGSGVVPVVRVRVSECVSVCVKECVATFKRASWWSLVRQEDAGRGGGGV